jgi:hypothetical protein
MMSIFARIMIPARWNSGRGTCQIRKSSTAHPSLLFRVIPLALIALGATLLSERQAYAYTDPGTGLLAIQAAGSALVATGWYLRRKIYALFHRTAPKTGPDELADTANGEESPNP